MPSLFTVTETSRSIYLFDAIYSWSTEPIVKDLLRMNDENKTDPINIFINSPGGLVTDTLAIIDVMNSIEAPINTIILGTAYSAASLIAACGNKRFISTNSEMMIHEAAMQGYGYIDTRDEKFTNNLKRIEELNNRINSIYADKTGQSFEEVNKIMSSKDDIFMNPQEAIKFGLVDEVLTEDDLKTIKLSESFKTIKLSESFALNEDESKEEFKTVHLLKACSLSERGVEITEETLKALKANFDSNVRGQDISIDYTHENDNGENPAAAWIKELSLDEDNKNLFGKVEFTGNAKKMIEDKEYKYLSVEIDPLYQDEKGKMYSNVLLGGTFTNRPAVKGLKPLKLSENINNNNKIDMELTKDEIASIEAMRTDKIEVKDFHKSFTAMKASNESLTKDNKELANNFAKAEKDLKAKAEEITKIEAEKIEAEKLACADSLVEKGIIANAQKEKVLAQFSSKESIEDFYKDVPAVVSVKAKGADLEDPQPVDNEIKEIAKQSGVSEKDIVAYLEKTKK